MHDNVDLYEFSKSFELELGPESKIVFVTKIKTNAISGSGSGSGRLTTLTKHVKNQTNCCIALEKMKKIYICLVFIYL